MEVVLEYIIFNKSQSHPKTFRMEDFENLIQADKLWARKFDATLDIDIINRLLISIKE